MTTKFIGRVFKPAALVAAGLVCCAVGVAAALAADPPKTDGPLGTDDPLRKEDPLRQKRPPAAQANPQAEPGNPKSKSGARPAPKGLALGVPRTPAQREKALSDLYAQLAAAEDEAASKRYAAQIERIWLDARSDTVGLLMERALNAAQAKNIDLALKLLDAVVELQPDYAEGWNRRAYVYFLNNDVQHALGDLRRVLALDPSHYKALDGLAQVLRDIGEKKAALAALRTLLEVHPYWPGAKQAIDELAREVEGRGI